MLHKTFQNPRTTFSKFTPRYNIVGGVGGVEGVDVHFSFLSLMPHSKGTKVEIDEFGL